MKKSSFLALAVAPMILGATVAVHGQSVSTDPVGFVKTELPQGYTAVGINMLKPAIASGKVVSASGSNVELSTEVILAAGKSYYLEVADGALEGDRIDVASASGNTVTLNLSAAHNTVNTNALEVDSRVIIREHYTFADLTAILGDSLHTGANFPDSSDQVLTWENGFVSHAIFEGDWFDSGGNSADDKILAPGSGFLFYANPDAPSRELNLTVLGEVRTNDFVRPLEPGYQLVSIGFPVDESPASLLLNEENLEGSDDPSSADQILIWDNGFAENWMFTDGSWYDAGGNPVTDTALLKADNAVLMNLNQGDNDYRVANRVQ